MFFRRKRDEQTDTASAPHGAVAILERPAAPPHPIIITPAASDGDAAAPSERNRRRRSRGPRREGGPANPEQAAARAPQLPRPAASHSEHFRALGVDDVGLDAIASLGYELPTPIQEASLPLLNDGGDLVGIAQTGTGKTIAFGLPLARTIDPSVEAVQAIVLVPTRELAAQVRDVMDLLGRFYGFHVLGLMGGSRVATDLRALERGTHVVVGTPGRVIDHLQRGTLDLRNVHFVVLDEADQMLDIGFARDIDRILRNVPKERQTALFSATMPESISRIVYRYMRGARRVSITPEQKTVENVVQQYCEVAERDKIRALQHLYETTDLGRSLIFRRTKIGVDRLTEQLQRNGIPARAIHGDLRQGERDRVMADFKSGNLQFLIATNVAARGLDIPDIEHVINYDVPQNAEEYIHRIGRTARAGKRGLAITFVGEWELEEWDRIVTAVGPGLVEHLRIPARTVAMGGARKAEASA